jgi:putative flavoprotein involved in K+ transport
VTRDGDDLLVETAAETLAAGAVVLATGTFTVPVVPAASRQLPPGFTQLHSSASRRPADLPAGPVPVVGPGNTGVQVAADLAGSHQVTLAVGTRNRSVTQRPLGRDLF